MSDTTQQKDYKETLNLPSTDFPMRANLPQREPEMLARWQEADLYGELRRQRAGRERWVLHDGPPYANGHIHLGHAVDKIQKDMIVRSRSMKGYDAPYVPGWDCHGMPIEINVQREFQERGEQPGLLELGRDAARTPPSGSMSSARSSGASGAGAHGTTPTSRCRTSTRRTSWKCSATWSKAATSTGVCARFTGARSARPPWPKQRSNITTRDPLDHGQVRLREDPHGVFGQDAESPGVLIWTTTPWTLPANRAVVVHPDVEYVVETRTAARCCTRPTGTRPWRDCSITPGSRAGCPAATSSASSSPTRSKIARARLFLADHVSTTEGTGVVHTAPGHGAEDFAVGRGGTRDLQSGRTRRGLPRRDTGLRGNLYLGREPAHHRRPGIARPAARKGELCMPTRTAGAARTRSSSATCSGSCRSTTAICGVGAGGDRQGPLDPRGDRKSDLDHGRSAPTGASSRQRAWGVGIPAVYCRRCEELFSTWH